MVKTALLWYERAIRDLDCAFTNARFYPKKNYLEVVCFLCQQAVEKNLKAFLYDVGELDVPRTHDLKLLRALCEKHDAQFKNPKIHDVCRILNRYAVHARYPEEIEILESDASRALHAAKYVEQFPTIRQAYAALRAAKAQTQDDPEIDDDEYER